MEKKDAQNTNTNVLLSANRHKVTLSITIEVSKCLFPLPVLPSPRHGLGTGNDGTRVEKC